MPIASAEAVQDRPVVVEAAPRDPSKSERPGAGVTPDSLTGMFDRYLEAFQKVYGPGAEAVTKAEAEAGKTRERAVRPAIERMERATEAPLPPLPKTEPAPAVPSLRVRPFLSTEGRGNLEGVINGLGLIAQVFTGIAAKAPVAALGAVTGAMQGWAKGDAVRAERSWREYLGQVDKIRNDNTEALRLWEAAMQQYGANTQAAQAHLTASLAEAGLDDHAILMAERGLERGLAPLKEAERLSKDVWDRSLKLLHEQNLDRLREEMRQDRVRKEREAQELRREAEAEYTPEVLERLGQQWVMDPNGRMPSIGFGGPAALKIRAKIVSAGTEWAKKQGLDPNTLPAVRAEIGAARASLTDSMKRRAFALSNAANFEKHLDTLLDLSEKTERSQSPAFNRYQLWVQGQYAGDPEVAAFNAQAFEVAMEFAKLMVGTAQGDEASRKEARETINNALNVEQLKAVAATLKRNATRRIDAWNETVRDQRAIIEKYTAPVEKPKAEGKLRVRRKSDGQPGTIDAADLSDLYEVIK